MLLFDISTLLLRPDSDDKDDTYCESILVGRFYNPFKINNANSNGAIAVEILLWLLYSNTNDDERSAGTWLLLLSKRAWFSLNLF